MAKSNLLGSARCYLPEACCAIVAAETRQVREIMYNLACIFDEFQSEKWTDSEARLYERG